MESKKYLTFTNELAIDRYGITNEQVNPFNINLSFAYHLIFNHPNTKAKTFMLWFF